MDTINDDFYFGKVLDPIEDEGFKLIFGREKVSECLIIDLLNSIFVNDPILSNITEVTFTNTEKPNESAGGRGIRYDIRCTTSTGHHFIVEMQKAEQSHFTERCLYYVSRDIAEQGFKGTGETNKRWDFSLMPVVGIFFCNFHIKGIRKAPIVYARLMDEETFQPIGDYQRYIFIQLPYFRKEEEECISEIEQWIYNIKHMGPMQSVAFKEQRDIFQYLDSVANVSALTPSERATYEAALMRARDYNAQMKTAREKAMAEGRAEGEAEGRLAEKKMMVRNMNALGLPVSTIAQVAELSEEEVRELI